MSPLLLTLAVLAVALVVLAFLLFSNRDKCKHSFGAPLRCDESEWYEHEYTMPQLPGKVFRVYRRDVVLAHRCAHCGKLKFTSAYDQKPHESDTMHRTPENFVPQPAPAPVDESTMKTLRK